MNALKLLQIVNFQAACNELVDKAINNIKLSKAKALQKILLYLREEKIDDDSANSMSVNSRPAYLEMDMIIDTNAFLHK
jgi:hypothetical protein